jgi:hypothetical protein
MGRAVPSLRETPTIGRDSAAPSAPRETPSHFATATHEALFESRDEHRCDVCGAELHADEDTGCAIGGAGMFVWARGDEVRRENAPLCSDCGTAVFASAVGRFDLDEE